MALRGAPTIPKDLDVAKRLATSAETAEPGFANYILGWIAKERGSITASIDLFHKSMRAGFVPAVTAIADVHSAMSKDSRYDATQTEKLVWLGIKGGHIPALPFLCRFYMKGARGSVKLVMGAVLWPLTMALLGFFSVFIYSMFAHFVILTDIPFPFVRQMAFVVGIR
jgi:hypothetical protein